MNKFISTEWYTQINWEHNSKDFRADGVENANKKLLRLQKRTYLT